MRGVVVLKYVTNAVIEEVFHVIDHFLQVLDIDLFVEAVIGFNGSNPVPTETNTKVYENLIQKFK